MFSHLSVGVTSKNAPTAHCANLPSIMIGNTWLEAMPWCQHVLWLTQHHGQSLCGFWERNKVWNVWSQKLICVILDTEDSILISVRSKLKFSPVKNVLNYAAYTNINAPCIFPFFDENLFLKFTRISVFIGYKSTADNVLNIQDISCVLDYLSHIVWKSLVFLDEIVHILTLIQWNKMKKQV